MPKIVWRQIHHFAIECDTHKICVTRHNGLKKYTLWIKSQSDAGKTVFDMVEIGSLSYLKQIVFNYKAKHL